MKIIILTSCTGAKRHAPEHLLRQADFYKRLTDPQAFAIREASLVDYRERAEEMYTGRQHLLLMQAVHKLRLEGKHTVNLYILSAGYGVIPAEEEIVPYECTFTGMKEKAAREWAMELNIPQTTQSVLAQTSDLTLVLLGDSYLSVAQLDSTLKLGGPTLFLAGAASHPRIGTPDNGLHIPLTAAEATRFRCGLVSLKGQVAALLIQALLVDACEPLNAWRNGQLAFAAASDAILRCAEAQLPPPKPRLPQVIPNPRVQQAITISPDWQARRKNASLHLFVPDWDDSVDPDYDFVHDVHSGGRGNWTNQVYAHQIYPEPTYDGLLVSKAVIEKSKTKHAQIQQMGIHRYLRVPNTFDVMGDCGAFSYLLHDTPPYSTADVVQYYTAIQVNYGVSVDHLLFGADDEAGRKARYDLTVANAAEFFDLHRAANPSWTPIGAIQASNPVQFAHTAYQYVHEFGYRYIGLGGLVRSNTEYIKQVLAAVHQALGNDSGVRIHLFGVARKELLPYMRAYGVTSADTASYLRQAWMRRGQNYIGADEQHTLYAAIRVPEAAKQIKKLHPGVEQTQAIITAEQNALALLQQIDQDERCVEPALAVLVEYLRLIGQTLPDRLLEDYRTMLKARPWKVCDCAICRQHGVEVLIFRGNNRNRRRGFHNNYVFFHQQLPRALNRVVEPTAVQQRLFADALLPEIAAD